MLTPQDRCSKRAGRPCAPVNSIEVQRTVGGRRVRYSSCSCGVRFPVVDNGRFDVFRDFAERVQHDHKGVADLKDFAAQIWPKGIDTWAKDGIVPVGQTILHRPTSPVSAIDPSVEDFVDAMVDRMHAADGVGLAAPQVGLGVSVFVHALRGAAPAALLNPKIVASSGSWSYAEGCLSLVIDFEPPPLTRPDRVSVIADLAGGALVKISAGELLSRVFQHEIDHLNGIEYIQRLDRSARRPAYRRLRQLGVDTQLLPPIADD
jgi:peptide deformylase